MPITPRDPDGSPVGDIWLEVAKGTLDGYHSIHKFGHNGSVGTSEETIWDGGGIYPWLTSAVAMSIVSDDANDDIAGTGARTVIVQGLDTNFLEVEEEVELDGLTPVITTQTFIRVFRARVLTAGSGGVQAGDITISNGGTTYAQMLNGHGQTLMCIYTVPKDHTAFIMYGKATSEKGKNVAVKFYVRPFGGVFNIGHYLHLYEGNYDYPFRAIPVVSEKSDIDVRAISDLAATNVSAAFDIILIHNQLLR